MAIIDINESLWKGVSDAEKIEIANHLKKHRLLRADDTISGNPNIAQSTDEFSLGDLNLGKVLCQIGCDAAAAGATAALTLAGPALAAAIAAIAAAHQVCRNSC